MSSDDEDNLCRFGTPLDPIEEDAVPSAKKITLADQIAVDSNGKRRFHGAFTGGFSAGFWNTVGSRDGWTPSEFKSSRGEKASHRVQKPSDFMDDEDVSEFGIAPQRIQTTEDFGASDGRSTNKRKLQTDTAQGPIPGVPVLEVVLESCHDKAAVRLLKRMDKKYAATLVEKPKNSVVTKVVPDDEPVQQMDSIDLHEESVAEASNEMNTNEKVYKCDMGPIMRPTRSNSMESSSTNSHDDVDDDNDNEEGLIFDTDEFDKIFDNLKSNRFGLNYVGLDKENFFATVGADAPIIQNNFNMLPTFTMVDQNKKKVTIKGQAFGVGAFEEDDDDIYGREDMSNYDFRLDSKTESKSRKAIKDVGRGYINGFGEAKQTLARVKSKNLFEVRLPFGYEPRNWLKRKSRFGPETITSTSATLIKGPADKVIGRHDLTPDQRGEILGDKKKDRLSDIDAKLKAAGLKTMNFQSGGIENKTDEQPLHKDLNAKIDDTLATFRNKTFIVPETIPQIFDRFTASNDSKPLAELNPTKFSHPEKIAVAPKEVQKVKRTKSTWIPCQLLCYKMNMEANVGTKPEKGNTFSLFECIANTESARRNRLEFTSRKHEGNDCLDVTKSDQTSEQQQKDNEPNKSSQMEVMSTSKTSRWSNKPPIVTAPTSTIKSVDMSGSAKQNESNVEIPIIKRNKPKTELELKIIETQEEHPSKKKDIFKAIFDSDSESDESNDDGAGTSQSTDTLKSGPMPADILDSLTKPSTSTSAMYSQLPDGAFRPKTAKEMNILRNTSPPRGIFSDLLKKPEPIVSYKSNEMMLTDTKVPNVDNNNDSPNTYGPSLPPPKPISGNLTNPLSSTATASSSSVHSNVATISLGKHSDYKVVYEEKWIEKSDEKEKKSKKQKKHKKDRNKHKSKKQKKEKHKRKKR